MVGRGLLVPAGEQAHDAVGMGIEGADEDVEIVRVVGHAGLGPEPGWAPSLGLAWRNRSITGADCQTGIVVPSVEHRRGVCQSGADLGCGRGNRLRPDGFSLKSQHYGEDCYQTETPVSGVTSWTPARAEGLDESALEKVAPYGRWRLAEEEGDEGQGPGNPTQ